MRIEGLSGTIHILITNAVLPDERKANLTDAIDKLDKIFGNWRAKRSLEKETRATLVEKLSNAASIADGLSQQVDDHAREERAASETLLAIAARMSYGTMAGVGAITLLLSFFVGRLIPPSLRVDLWYPGVGA